MCFFFLSKWQILPTSSTSVFGSWSSPHFSRYPTARAGHRSARRGRGDVNLQVPGWTKKRGFGENYTVILKIFEMCSTVSYSIDRWYLSLSDVLKPYYGILVWTSRIIQCSWINMDLDLPLSWMVWWPQQQPVCWCSQHPDEYHTPSCLEHLDFDWQTLYFGRFWR